MCARISTRAAPRLYLYGQKDRAFNEDDLRFVERLARHVEPSVRAFAGTGLADRARGDRGTDATVPWRERLHVDGLIGRSEALVDVFAYIASAAPLDRGRGGVYDTWADLAGPHARG